MIQEAADELQQDYQLLKVVELLSVREDGDQIKMRVRVSDDVYNELLGI